MLYTDWSITNTEYVPEKRQSRDALFTVSNGYFGIRGFFEEDTHTIGANGGIYMTGVFGLGSCDAWEGKSRELCNVPNLLRVVLSDHTAAADGVSGLSDFSQTLDLRRGVYSRRYCWTASGGARAELTFERFANLENVHTIGQRVTVRALDDFGSLSLDVMLDSGVTNLNEESCEPLPIQPGKNHIRRRDIQDDSLTVVLDDPDATVLYFAQTSRAARGGADGTPGGASPAGSPLRTDTACGTRYSCSLKAGESLSVEKIVFAVTSLDAGLSPAEEIAGFLAGGLSYRQALADHQNAWLNKWDMADIVIRTDTHDNTVMRYNLFQLIGVCPSQTDRAAIGGRGLSGEMYEGCVFWDNEIFVLPFFLYTDPQAAQRQLSFRYHTLNAARRHAVNNWFEGAMFPWQASKDGIEQTPYNVGAYYAVHISADIALALCRYADITGDDAFMLRRGAEILYETARFWSSRCDRSEIDGKYHIRAVRGPNEYDVFVSDNAYTNMLAANNLLAAGQVIARLRVSYPSETDALLERIGGSGAELERFSEIARKLVIPYCAERNLYLEDDAYLLRRPLDLARAKPTRKRIIDSTLPYEALPLYQVTKQSDAVLLCCLFPNQFTPEQKKNIYAFYEPRTAHDSSLSYAPHATLAAQIGLPEEAYRYFRKSAYLDIDDLQLNTVSGLHFANFGGTWQTVFHGFAGISHDADKLYVRPALPREWESLTLRCYFHGVAVQFSIHRARILIKKLRADAPPVTVCVDGSDYVLADEELCLPL